MTTEFHLSGFLDEIEKISAASPPAIGALAGGALFAGRALSNELKLRTEEEGKYPDDVLQKARRRRLPWHVGSVALGATGGAVAGHYAPQAYDKVKGELKKGLGSVQGRARSVALDFVEEAAKRTKEVNKGAFWRLFHPNKQ